MSQGIQTWKSSLVEQAHVAGTQSVNAGVVQDEIAVARGTEADVFTPEKELKEYLERAANSGAGKSTGSVYTPTMDDEVEIAEVDTITKPAPASRKSSRPSSSKKSNRATDVEDVLAAGVGGFIEVIGNADKKKIAYGIVYVFCAGVFAVACFDASRKFPSVSAVPGTNVVAASASSFGNLDLSDTLTSQQAIEKSRKLVASGDLESAVSLLRKQLASGSKLRDRDSIRVELATILNSMAEQSLKNNKLQESVEKYHEALQILPGDAALQLRLSNALYYAGTIGTSSEENKKPMLGEAKTLLSNLTAKDPVDLQALRLLALVHESLGEKELANVSWKKVRSSAPEESAERKEAEKHLK